ncbi:MAG: zinc-ribbon domain containing protein [Selenomonadaceae bacterium]|nr:zinc-ribbon domain containing protein [Selenomonadaceae bacterium]
MAFEDKTLVCKDCGKEYIFSAGEQEFYAEKGFENEPARCRDCRDKRRRSHEGGEGRQMHKVICADCGKETEVPFLPKNDRPVYCRDCFSKHRLNRGA